MGVAAAIQRSSALCCAVPGFAVLLLAIVGASVAEGDAGGGRGIGGEGSRDD